MVVVVIICSCVVVVKLVVVVGRFAAFFSNNFANASNVVDVVEGGCDVVVGLTAVKGGWDVVDV